MKLWKKLALFTSGILFLLCTAMEAVVITQTGEYALNQAVEIYKEELNKTLSAIEAEKGFYREGEWSEVVEKSFLQYAFKKYGEKGYILTNDGEALCNNSEYDIANADWEESRQIQVHEQKIDGKNLVILSRSAYNLGGGEDGRIFLIKDITHLYTEMVSRMVLYGCISLFLTALVAVLVFLIVKRLLKPLEELQRAAEGIGNGELAQKVKVHRLDEVGTVARAFNHMSEKIQNQVQELEDVAEKRQQLLGSLAHEMKTPMTSIIGYSDTLLRVHLNEEQKEKALHYIKNECKRLESLSAKLMNLIGMYENGAIDFEDCQVETVLRRVQLLEEVRLKERNMKLFITNTMGIRKMDRELMESLLINLIDNAMKASPDGGSIDVIASGNKITVGDSGVGIPKEEIPQVTEAFYMVDKSRSRKSGGVGLGLALCRQIAELHQARLEIESTVGEGTRVSVVFED